MPVIRNQYAEILPEMSIWVGGSVGLGIDDELSDLDANIYLDEPLWKKHGAALQLTVERLLLDTNPYWKSGSGIYVQPLSWLLDGQGEKFLDSTKTPPWTKVSIPSLFSVQESLIIHDPSGNLRHLREGTTPSKRPESLWKKSLLLELKDFADGDYKDFRRNVLRGHLAEAYMSFGRVVEELFHLGFLIARRYYPWRTHLRWALEELPAPIKDIGINLDSALTATDWHEKLEIVKTVFNAYRNYITDHAVFPEIDLSGIDLNDSDYAHELIWAERVGAWKKPDWREWIIRCTEKAVRDGHPPESFWVYSLWGLD